MKVRHFVQFLLVVPLICSSVEEGKKITLELKTGESQKITFASQFQNLILYVRVSDSSSDTIGQIDATYLSQVVDLDGNYQSAFFRDQKEGDKEINFQCIQGPCKCSLAAYSQDEGQIISDQETKLELTKQKPVVSYLINLPKKTAYDHLIFSIRTDDDSLDMDHVGLDIFGQMNVKSHIEKTRLFFFVDSDDKETCEECSIDIVVSADNKKSKSILWLNYEIFQRETVLELNKKKIDYLTHFQKPNRYNFTIPADFQVIIMQIIPYAKLLPRVFGSVDKQITSPEQAEFDSFLEGEYIAGEIGLIFHPEDLIGITLYLAVSGIQALYSIEMIKQDEDPLLYIDGVFASQLQVDSVHNYLFKAVPVDDENNKFIQIVLQTFDLKINQKPLDLYLLECKTKQCKSDVFKEYNILIDQSSQFYSYSTENHCQKLTLEPKCSDSDDGFCWYKLAIKGNEAFKKMHYSIYALNTQSEMKIKANRPYTNTILEGDMQGLVFYYEPKKHDVSLIFTISSPHTTYYISNKPNCRPVTFECAIWEGSTQNAVIIRDLKAGAYYISIQGLLTTEYTFTVEVLNKRDTSIITLQNGQKQRSELHPGQKGEDIKYFQFEVELDSTKPDIQLNIEGPKYKLAVVLNKGEELPSLEGFDKITLNNFMVIQSSEKKIYQRSGIYSVSVEYIQHDTSEELENQAIPFAIIFTTSDSLKSLTMNEVYFDEVMAGKTNIYSMLLNNDIYGNGILLSKQKIQPANPKKDVKIYLNSMPDRENSSYEIPLKTDQSSTYEINSSSIQKLCENPKDEEDIILNKDEVFICEIFIFIENPSNDRLSYSLILWMTGLPIELHEGHALTFNLENIEMGQQMQFFYHPVSYTYDVQFFIHSYYGSISYNLQIYSTDNDNIQNSQLTFEGIAHNSHSKQISPTAFDHCKPKCIIKVQITAPNSLETLIDKKPREVEIDDTFNILVSQKFMEIRSGQPIEVTVSKKPHYFLYNDLKSLLQDSDASIVISINEYMGKAVLCLSVSDNTNIRMPFIEDTDTCDFEVYENEFKLTRENFKQLIKENNLNEEDNPILIIQLSNLNKGSQGRFIIYVNKLDCSQLLLAVPLPVDMDQKEQRSFSFFNYVNEDLEFKVVRLAGYGYLSISRCLNDVAKQCKNETIIDRKFLAGQSSSFIQVSTKSKHFCVLCTYYIDLETEEKITLTALITVTTQSEFIKISQGIQFTDYLEEEDVNRYRVTIDPTKQIEVQVKIYSGEPQTSLFFLPNKTQYGPYYNPNHYEAIIPPKQHLDLNQNLSSSLQQHFNEDDLYIQVSNIQGNSNYTITVMQQNGHLLQDGLITQVQLSKMQQNITLYYYHLYSQYQPLLLIKCREQELAQDDGNYLVKVTGRVAKSYQKNGFENTTLQLVSGHKNELHYLLPSQDGFYEIIVESTIRSSPNEPFYVFDSSGKPVRQQSNYDYDSNFVDRLTLDIAVNSKDVFLLESDVSSMRGYVYPNQANFYELQVHEPNVALQVQNCQGNLKVSYTQNYKKFLDEKYKSSSNSQSGLTYETLIKAKEGPLYIAIHGNGQEMGSYKLITQQLNKMPHGKVFSGGDGIVDWELEPTDPDKVTVRFKPLECNTCDVEMQENSEVSYQIVWGSEELIVNELGKCEDYLYNKYKQSDKNIFGVSNDIKRNLIDKDELKVNVNVEFQSEQSVLYISVVAKLQKFDGTKVNDFKIFYRNSKMYLPKNVIYMFKHKRNEFTIAVGVLLGFSILMCCCLGYFFSRLRKLRKDQLEVDLQKKMQEAKEKQQKEVSNQQENKKGYGKLEEEKDVEQQQN